MSNDMNNIQDLLDDSIQKSLRTLGLTFPKNAADFKKLELDISKANIIQPNRLKDPSSFLSKRSYHADKQHVELQNESDYQQNLAQAAREGNKISEDIKKKMADDKQKIKKGKTDQ